LEVGFNFLRFENAERFVLALWAFGCETYLTVNNYQAPCETSVVDETLPAQVKRRARIIAIE